MCQDKTARIIIKQGSGVPTIPVSADHRNGDWIATDIYEGEQYMDTDTGIVYTRSSTGIEAVGGGSGGVKPRVYKALISQASTNAPVLTELVNDFGVTVTPTYGAVGAYTLTGFTGLITGLTEVSITCPDNAGTTFAKAGGTASTNIISISTSASGVASNDVLSNDPASANFGASVITVVKYD